MNLRCSLAGILFTASLLAADETPAPPPKKSAWNLEIVPKAFQKNPEINITVLSELSDAGRRRGPVTLAEPAYYIMESAGYHVRGEVIKQQPYPASEVERILQRALAAGGYFPATGEHSPTLALVYMYGAHNVISPGNALTADQIYRNILDRAALAGGEKFAAELSKAFKQSVEIAESTAQPLGIARGVSDMDAVDLGAAASLNQISGMTDPVRMFKEKSLKNDLLLSQATSNCYFVVATAFDYASLASGSRQVLWRMRLTVTSDGISQLDAIPALISVATPFFGKDMPESAIIRRSAVQKGSVEVGAPTVVEPPPKPVESK